jgi:hypothetical protein
VDVPQIARVSTEEYHEDRAVQDDEPFIRFG